MVALIAHQRDQRRDDNGRALAEQRGQLEAQALAAASSRQHEAVSLLAPRLQHSTLPRVQCSMPKRGHCLRESVFPVRVRVVEHLVRVGASFAINALEIVQTHPKKRKGVLTSWKMQLTHLAEGIT